MGSWNDARPGKMAEPAPFNIMTKPIGPRCNIDCKYCYYLEKEDLYPTEKKFRMSDEMLERYVIDMIAASLVVGQNQVHFAWQGGEPTMLGLDYFRRIVALQEKHRPQGVGITNAIQTNGILIDESWALFLTENHFLVGVSVDGTKKVHDRYRIDRAGRPTFDLVMRGLDHLRNAGADYNILTTVHRANAGKGKEIYRFLRELGSEYLQFIPIVERRNTAGALARAPQIDTDHGNLVTDWSVSPRAYGKFLCDVFDLWYRQDLGRVFVQFFETQVGLWAGQPSALCVFAETCGNGLALEHNGDLYACDHFVYPEYRLGNISQTPLRDLVWSDKVHEFGQGKSKSLTAQCRACSYRFACNGGCPKHRILATRDGKPDHNYFCESYTMFFQHAGDRLVKLARQAGMPIRSANPMGPGPA